MRARAVLAMLLGRVENVRPRGTNGSGGFGDDNAVVTRIDPNG
jgi:hypothetical protein